MRIAATMTLAAMLGCSLLATTVASAADTNAPAATTHSAKATSLKACNKQADSKKLTGAERTTFVKDCHAGKMN